MSINQINQNNIPLVTSFREKHEGNEANAWGSKDILYRVQCRVGMEEGELSKIINKAHSLLIDEYNGQGGLTQITSSVVLVIGTDKKVESINLLTHADNSPIELDQSIVSRVNSAADNHPLADQSSVKFEAQGDLQSPQPSAADQPSVELEAQEAPSEVKRSVELPDDPMEPLSPQPIPELRAVYYSNHLPAKEVDDENTFTFKHQDVSYRISHNGLSEEGQDKIIEDIIHSHTALVSKCQSSWTYSPNQGIIIKIDVADDTSIKDIYYTNSALGVSLQLSNTLISRSNSETKNVAEKVETSPESQGDSQSSQSSIKEPASSLQVAELPAVDPKPSTLDSPDDIEYYNGSFDFNHEGIRYSVWGGSFSKDEKEQIAQNIRDSHESLVAEYNVLHSESPHSGTMIFIDYDKANQLSDIYYGGMQQKYRSPDPSFLTKKGEQDQSEESHSTKESVSPLLEPDNLPKKEVDDENTFTFSYQGVNYRILHDGLSAEEQVQIRQNIEHSHESLMNKSKELLGERLSENAQVSIEIDSERNIKNVMLLDDLHFKTNLKESDLGLTVISKPKEVLSVPTPEEEKPSVEPQGEPEKPVMQQADVQLPQVTHAYEEFRGGLGFEHQRVQYYVTHKDNLSREEKDKIIEDVKNSHKSLINKYAQLSGEQSNDCVSVIIDINSDKEINAITSRGHNGDNIDLEPSLVSGNNLKEAFVVDSNNLKPTEPASSHSPTEGIQPSQANNESSPQIANPPKLETPSAATNEGEPQGEPEKVTDSPEVSEDLEKEQPQGDQPKITEPTSEPKVKLDHNREVEAKGNPGEPASPPEVSEELAPPPQAHEDAQSSDVGLISSLIYILTKPLSLALSVITSVISWVFGSDEEEPGLTHHDHSSALPEPSAEDVEYNSMSTDSHTG